MTRSFLLFSILSLFVSSGSADAQRSNRRSTVRGAVTDVSGAWVILATVTFQSHDFAYRTNTNGKGFYSASLPAGEYTISVTHTGFCDFRRGEFIASPGSQINFDFRLWVCPTDSYGKYNYIELPDANSGGPEPLMLYGENSLSGDVLTFTGPDFRGSTPDYPAVLTFDRFTFVADRFVYNRTQKLLRAEGNVSWYKDSAKPTRASKIELFFKRTTPRIRILAD